MDNPAAFSVSALRQGLKTAKEALKATYSASPKPERLLRDNSALTDRTLKALWGTLQFPRSACLVAVGGYGRQELYPYSDVDILLLIEEHNDALHQEVTQFVSTLWDIGLEVGHSLRTVEETLEEARKDLTVLTNVIESRVVVGDTKRFKALQDALKASTDRRLFMDGKLTEQKLRHRKHNDTAFNLEPNVKESPGGLRDFQTLLWLAWGAGIGRQWNDLIEQKVMTVEEFKEVKKHTRILQDLRIRLHFLTGRREDRLLFDVQNGLAQSYHFEAQGHRRASERLMQRFFKTAKTVEMLNIILTSQIRSWHPSPQERVCHPIDARFARWGRRLGTWEVDAFQKDPSLILIAVLTYQRHPEVTGFTPAALRGIWQAKNLIDDTFRRNPANRQTFLQILKEPRRVTDALRRMNRSGILGRYIPAFGRIEGQMQHDLFHVYTVDEHILRVLRNVRRFMVAEFDHEFPLCSQLMQNFENPEVLYVAALFHDIAKGRGGDHSSLGARDCRRFAKVHGLSDEDVALASWLVDVHLQMSSTAQKQDLSDPEVIEHFTHFVKTERRLIALYLLTVADIRGTSPKVWNAWKGKLLEDLFRASRRFLSAGKGSLQDLLNRKREKAKGILAQYGLKETHLERFWSTLDDSYFQRHEAQEIAWHTRFLHAHVQGTAPTVRARLSPLGEGIQILIYAPDELALFARICGFFDANAYSIEEAKIYTTQTGRALDTFQVLYKGQSESHYRNVLSSLEVALQDHLSQKGELKRPISGRISRHVKHFPIEARAGLSTPDRSGHRVLTLSAGDQPGLLYRVARVLLEHKVSLHGAKISTLGDKAEDSLLISGAQLSTPEAEAILKQDLVSALSF